MDVPALADLNLAVTIPTMGLALWACIVLLIDLFVPEERTYLTAWFALGGLGVAFVFNLSLFALAPGDHVAFLGMYQADGFTSFVNIAVLAGTAVAIFASYEYAKRTGIARGEYYPLMLISASGAMLMGAAHNLVVLFIALEMLSIPLYIMSGMRRGHRLSEESATKYFLLGAFSSSFLVYGIALVYGAVGSTDLNTIFDMIGAGQNVLGHAIDAPLLVIGAGLMVVGLGFKVAAVPFHMWTPDVYQGAPTAVTAFMSVVAKVGGFAGLMRVIGTAMPPLAGAPDAFWQDSVAVIAAITMILGNVVAVAQRDLKRMLAYSSIAHAGYLMMGIAAAGTPEATASAVSATLFYMLAYTFTNLGAFAVVIALEQNDGSGNLIEDFAGLNRRRPVMAAAMAIFMFSLTGIPPSAGMVGKFFVFGAAVHAGLAWLALIGLLTSIISAFYYVRVVVTMYMDEPEDDSPQPQPLQSYLGVAVIAAAAGTVLLGVLPMDPASLVNGVAMLIIGG